MYADLDVYESLDELLSDPDGPPPEVKAEVAEEMGKEYVEFLDI